MRKEQRLTEEQDEVRLAGLRILARLIVHAHLISPIEGERVERYGSDGEDSAGRPADADSGHPWDGGRAWLVSVPSERSS